MLLRLPWELFGVHLGCSFFGCALWPLRCGTPKTFKTVYLKQFRAFWGEPTWGSHLGELDKKAFPCSVALVLPFRGALPCSVPLVFSRSAPMQRGDEAIVAKPFCTEANFHETLWYKSRFSPKPGFIREMQPGDEVLDAYPMCYVIIFHSHVGSLRNS